MFISWQSYEGLQIAVFSFKAVCKCCYNKVSLVFFQKGFVGMILKIILVNNVRLVVDLKIQLYMILDKMATQLRISFRSDPLEKMCKALQKNLMKYVMNLCRNEENERSLKKLIAALAVGRVRDY